MNLGKAHATLRSLLEAALAILDGMSGELPREPGSLEQTLVRLSPPWPGLDTPERALGLKRKPRSDRGKPRGPRKAKRKPRK